MVDFSTKQFDQMHLDETKSIERGMVSDCDTLYVIGFDNANHHQTLAAVQYAASADGMFINWLAVEHKVHASVSYMRRNVGEKRILFRKLGIATFLLNLIQMQQIV